MHELIYKETALNELYKARGMVNARDRLGDIPPIPAIPLEFIEAERLSPDNAGHYSAMLARLKRRWEAYGKEKAQGQKACNGLSEIDGAD